MSVGGRVVYTRDAEFGLEVATWETSSPHDGFTATQVEVSEDAGRIESGDSFWWQGGWAYWTPQSRLRRDVKLCRTCNSYAVSARKRSDTPNESS